MEGFFFEINLGVECEPFCGRGGSKLERFENSQIFYLEIDGKNSNNITISPRIFQAVDQASKEVD